MKVTPLTGSNTKHVNQMQNVSQIKLEDGPKVLEQINKILDNSLFKTEEEKKAYEDKLNKKIKSGKKLSVNDMNYIRRTSPYMYMHVMRAQMKREMTVNRLENCKSKKDVQKVQISEIASIGDKDPDKEIMTSAVNDAVSEYKKTGQYKALPEEIKQDEEHRGKHKKQVTDETKIDIYQYKHSIVYAMMTDAEFDLEV